MKHLFASIVFIIFIGFLVGVTVFAEAQAQTQAKARAQTQAQAQSASAAGTPFASSMPPAPSKTGRGIDAIHDATAAGKLLFVFFHEATASQPSELETRFESLLAKEAASAARVVIDRKNPSEKDIVAKFQIQRAPMPLILAIAPNGAITTGFPADKLSETTIREAFVSKGMQSCLGPLQNGKLVILCLQNAKTTSNEAASAGAKEFTADPKLGPVTEIVTLDPADPAEASFLEKMRLTGNITEAQTIVLAPPAVIIGKFKGAVTKADLQTAIKKATSSGGGGCGDGGSGDGGCGCGPSGCGS